MVRKGVAWIRHGTDLPWLFLHRSIRPFHLATMIAMVVLFMSNVFWNETPLSSSQYDVWIASPALAAALLLFVGWLGRFDRVAEWGLLIATGVWVERFVLYVMQGETRHNESPWKALAGTSLAWAIGTGGAWLLERYEHHWHIIAAEAWDEQTKVSGE